MKSNLKWLLLIPVFAIAISLGYLIPTQLLSDDSGDDNTSTNKVQNQAIQIQVDDVQERINAYQALLQRNPNDIEALKGIGDNYLEMGKFQEQDGNINVAYKSYKNAVDQYRRYLSIKPDDAEVRKDLGLAYSYLDFDGMIDISLRELYAATAADPNNQRVWLSLGFVLYDEYLKYYEVENLTKARDAWQKAYNLNPASDVGLEAKTFLDQSQNSQLMVPSGIAP